MRTCVVALLLLITVSIVGLSDPLCPIDTIASESDVVTGAYGHVVVDACLTRSGGEDTYTYQLTYFGSWIGRPCGFSLSGRGKLTDTTTGASSGWTATTHPTTDCGSWWTWSESMIGSGSGAVPLMRILTLTLTIPEETQPSECLASVQFCGKGEAYLATLGPASSSYELEFIGEGLQVSVMRNPAVPQVLGECEPSWLRHGYIVTEDGLAGLFTLYIDGTEVPLSVQRMCRPRISSMTDGELLYFYTQFPAGYFEVGDHEVTGVWEPDDEPGADGVGPISRTITLRVVPCEPEPIPLADLRVELEIEACNCDWTKQQDYECTVAAEVVVFNDGNAAADAAGLIIGSGQIRRTYGLPEIGPGESYARQVELVLDATYGREPCPASVTATVDFSDQVKEMDEENNSAEAEICCK